MPDLNRLVVNSSNGARVGVRVGVLVGVDVTVGEGVMVAVGDAVALGVTVRVMVGLGVIVRVGVGWKYEIALHPASHTGSASKINRSILLGDGKKGVMIVDFSMVKAEGVVPIANLTLR